MSDSPPILAQAVPEESRPAVRYRAVSRAAIAGVVFGAVSVAAFFSGYLLLLPLIGAGTSWFALRRIQEQPEELTGRGIAWAGLGLSAGIGMLCSAWLLYWYIREVPPGYVRVDYEDLQPGPGEVLPQRAFELEGRKIFFKGFMLAPGRRQTNLKEFDIAPAQQGCQFCPAQPKRTEIVHVMLTGELRTDYSIHLMRVGGVLKVDPYAPLPYSIEADYVR
jgi:hypothetical protein